MTDTLCNQAGEQNIAVACFYFDFTARKEQTPTNMLGAPPKRVVSGMGEIRDGIMQDFRGQERTTGGWRLRLPEVAEVPQTPSSSRPTCICIGPPDRFPEGYQLKVLGPLKEVLQKAPSTRISLSGRPHIMDGVEKTPAGRVAIVSLSASGDDISDISRPD